MPSVPCIPEYLLLTQICSSSAVSAEPLCDSQGLISAHVPCGPRAGTIRCTPCGDRPLRVWAQWPHASSYNSVNYCPCATSPAHSLSHHCCSLQKRRVATSPCCWTAPLSTPSTGTGGTKQFMQHWLSRKLWNDKVNNLIFYSHSMLGSVEVNGLRPEKVEYVNIKVAADQQGPYMYRIKTFFHTFWYLIFVSCSRFWKKAQ